MRPKAAIVLEALLTGSKERTFLLATESEPYVYTVSRSIVLDGEEWLLVHTDDGLIPAVVRTLHRDTERWDTLLGMQEVSLFAFLHMTDRLSDADVFTLGCETVLTRDAEKRAEQRSLANAR